MAQRPDDQPRPARPLLGYRDVGEDVRHGKSAMTRAWIVLAILIVIYLVVDADDLLPRTGSSVAHVHPAPLVAGVLYVCGVPRGGGRIDLRHPAGAQGSRANRALHR